MARYEYMRLHIADMPEDVIEHYNFRDKAIPDGSVYCKIQKGVYSLPQAGIIAQQLLKEHLKKHGYRQSQTTSGLWKHGTRPISFSLVIVNVGVKYVGEENAQHLLDTVRQYYKCSCDWEGERYCGIAIKWDYKGRKVHLVMPSYLPKEQTHFKHTIPSTPQDQPYPHIKPNYGAKTQHTVAEDTSPPSIRRARDLSKRFAGHSCSTREASMAASSPHSAPSRCNRRNQRKTR